MKAYASFLFMIMGLMIVLNFAGINTTAGYIINNMDVIDNPQNFQNTNFYFYIKAIFAAAVLGGIVIGLFTKTSPESYLLAPLAGVLVLFVGDIILVVSYANANYASWVGKVVLALLMPLAGAYVITVIDWWRGTA